MTQTHIIDLHIIYLIRQTSNDSRLLPTFLFQEFQYVSVC